MADNRDAFSEFISSLARRLGGSFSTENLDAASLVALKDRLGEISTQKDLREALISLKNTIQNYNSTLRFASRNLSAPQQEEIRSRISAISQIGRGLVDFRLSAESKELADKLKIPQEKFAEVLGVASSQLESFNKLLDRRVGTELETFAQAVEAAENSLLEVRKGLRRLEDLITLEEAQRATFLQRSLKESPGAVSELLINRKYLDPGKMREIFGDSFTESVRQSSDLSKGLYSAARQIKEGTGFFESFFVDTKEISKIQKEALSSFLKESAFAKIEYKKTLNEIDEIIKSPKATEEEIAKQVERRRQIQKQLLDVTLEELNIRKKIFQETYGKLGETVKTFGAREIDYIGSTTRNPFWDILTSSLRFGVQTGLATASALGSMLNNIGGLRAGFFSPGIPGPVIGGGRGREARPREPDSTNSRPTGRNGSLGRRIISAGRANALTAALIAAGEIGYDYLTRTDDDSFRKELPRNLTTAGASIGAGLLVGGAVGQLAIPIPGVGFLSGLAASYLASRGAGALYDKFFGQNEPVKTPFNIANSQDSSVGDSIKKISDNLPLVSTNLFELNKILKLNDPLLMSGILGNTSMGGILGLSGLGRGGKFISNFLSGVLERIVPALAGVGAGGAAFAIDFYLQSLNKAYDIYFSQYTQQNLIPQAFRTALGSNVADISNALLLPGGLLKTGANALTNLGYTREELLATIPRVTSAMFTDSVRSMAEAIKEAGSAARIFGTAIGDSVGLIASARKALIDYKDIFGIARVIAGGENFTQFTKAMTESFINASLSLAIRQGTSPLNYANSITSLFSILSTSRNNTLNDIVRNNPDLAISALQSINEFIRGGISNPIAGGIAYRAGLTPRNILQGATPENLNRVLKELVRETGVLGQIVGGRFTSQATEYLLPLLQQQLGLGNISPDIFNEIVLAAATGRDDLARRRLSQATARGVPKATSADEGFGRQQEELLKAFQALTEVMKTNVDKVVALNVAVTDLSKNILKIGEPGGQFAVNALTTVVETASNITGRITGNTQPNNQRLLTDNKVSVPNVPALNAIQQQTQTQIPGTIKSGNGYVIFSTGEVSAIPVETLRMYLNKIMEGR